MKKVYRELQPNREVWLFRVRPPTEILNKQELEETFLKAPENR